MPTTSCYRIFYFAISLWSVADWGCPYICTLWLELAVTSRSVESIRCCLSHCSTTPSYVKQILFCYMVVGRMCAKLERFYKSRTSILIFHRRISSSLLILRRNG